MPECMQKFGILEDSDCAFPLHPRPPRVLKRKIYWLGKSEREREKKKQKTKSFRNI